MIRLGRADVPPGRQAEEPAGVVPAGVVVPRQRTSGPDEVDQAHDGDVALHPFLSFADGTAREALQLYASVLGGRLSITTFGEMGTRGPLAEQVMHGRLETPGGLTIMAADAPDRVQATPADPPSVSLTGDDAATVRAWFAALSEGAESVTPFAEQANGALVGSLRDRFGVEWLVTIVGDPAR